MKNLLLALAFIGFQTVFAQDSKTVLNSPANVGDTYGELASESADSKAISTGDLAKKLGKSDKKIEQLAVKGKVVEVCENEGCWLTLETENDERFFVKMKDHAFFVPKDLKTKTVIIYGNAENKIVPVEEMKHYAEDAGKSEKEIAKIKKPGKEIRFIASGVKVVE